MNVGYQATEQLALNASILYNHAKADWKGLNITTPAYVDDQTLTGTIYDIESINVITDYSDLEYQQTEVNLGGTYLFSPMLYLTAAVSWEQFEDNSPYVYGDQDGEMYSTSVGVGYKF